MWEAFKVITLLPEKEKKQVKHAAFIRFWTGACRYKANICVIPQRVGESVLLLKGIGKILALLHVKKIWQVFGSTYPIPKGRSFSGLLVMSNSHYIISFVVLYDMCNKVSILSLFEKELFYKLVDNLPLNLPKNYKSNFNPV